MKTILIEMVILSIMSWYHNSASFGINTNGIGNYLGAIRDTFAKHVGGILEPKAREVHDRRKKTARYSDIIVPICLFEFGVFYCTIIWDGACTIYLCWAAATPKQSTDHSPLANTMRTPSAKARLGDIYYEHILVYRLYIYIDIGTQVIIQYMRNNMNLS